MSPPCLTKNSEVGEKSGCEAYVRKKKSGRLRVKASNSPRDGKDSILMAKKVFEWRQLFSNDNVFLGRYAFIRSDVGRTDVLSQWNASICLFKNLNKMLHTVVYTKHLWHITRDLMVKYIDQPKIPPVLVLVRLLVFIELKLPTEVNF